MWILIGRWKVDFFGAAELVLLLEGRLSVVGAGEGLGG